MPPSLEIDFLFVQPRFARHELAAELDELCLAQIEVLRSAAQEALDRYPLVAHLLLAVLEIIEAFLEPRRVLVELSAMVVEQLRELPLRIVAPRKDPSKDAPPALGCIVCSAVGLVARLSLRGQHSCAPGLGCRARRAFRPTHTIDCCG